MINSDTHAPFRLSRNVFSKALPNAVLSVAGISVFLRVFNALTFWVALQTATPATPLIFLLFAAPIFIVSLLLGLSNDGIPLLHGTRNITKQVFSVALQICFEHLNHFFFFCCRPYSGTLPMIWCQKNPCVHLRDLHSRGSDVPVGKKHYDFGSPL